MFFILSKILSFLLNPAFWIFALLLCAWLLQKYRRRLLIITVCLFFVITNEFILMEFMRAWEIKPMNTTMKGRSYDTGIVLGGYANYDADYDLIGFHDSADRILEAIRLYEQGNIKKILLSGGSGNLRDTAYKESAFILNYLTGIGIPERDIMIDTVSKNTAQNAREAVKVLQKNKMGDNHLLITSGYHMRRSLACFNKLDLYPTPYSVDRKAGPRKYAINHLFVPNISAFLMWQILIHEWVGYLSYLIAGYI